MDQLRSLRVFVRVIDEGSFAGASRVLDLAPAVVTRVVAELEQHLGARLLNRTTRRLALTEIGEAYLERARQLLIDVEEADALAGASSSEARGTLRVLAPPAFAVHQLTKLLPRFRAKYPHVNLELALPGPVETVDENFDVSILSVAHATLHGDFVARRLACSDFIVCAAPDYLERRGRPRHPNELAHHDGVLPATSAVRRELTLYRGAANEAHAARSAVTIPTPAAALSTNHIDTIYAAALAGLGIAGLPSFVAAEALRQGWLERVVPDWRGVTLTLYAAMPSRKHVPTRTRVFVDFLVQTFGGEKRDPWLPAAGAVKRGARA
jgi:DNA-binding transcriptional LysR family regulator